jgi:hypothetical protein
VGATRPKFAPQLVKRLQVAPRCLCTRAWSTPSNRDHATVSAFAPNANTPASCNPTTCVRCKSCLRTWRPHSDCGRSGVGDMGPTQHRADGRRTTYVESRRCSAVSVAPRLGVVAWPSRVMWTARSHAIADTPWSATYRSGPPKQDRVTAPPVAVNRRVATCRTQPPARARRSPGRASCTQARRRSCPHFWRG